MEIHFLVVRDVSKLDCMIQLKLRTFQKRISEENYLSIRSDRAGELRKNTIYYTDEPSSQQRTSNRPVLLVV